MGGPNRSRRRGQGGEIGAGKAKRDVRRDPGGHELAAEAADVAGRAAPDDPVGAQRRSGQQELPEPGAGGGEHRDAREAQLCLAPLGGEGQVAGEHQAATQHERLVG